MKNGFLNKQPQRMLFSTVMFASLFAVSPFTAVAETMEMQTVMQSGQISGQVVDGTGEPVIGASVLVKGTSNGTITDFDGKFQLQNATGTLVISYIGYKTQEIPLTGQKILKIVLREDTEVLDEVVVVGYGVQKKATLSGSVAQVKGEEVLKGKSTQNIASALQGTIPGLTIQRTSSRPGNENATLTLRGGVSVNEDGNKPMILIDGVEAYDWELSQLNPTDIESISVLKDAAAAIYGTRAGGGVVLVTTKRGKTGKAKVTYSGSAHLNYIGNRFPLADGITWAKMMVEAQNNDFANPANTSNWWMWTSTNEDGLTVWERLAQGEIIQENVNGGYWRILDPTNEGTSNQFDQVYGSSWGQSHSISITGGTEKIKVMTSLGYSDDKSLIKAAYDGQKKYNFRTNVDYQVNDVIKLAFNLSYDNRVTASPTQGVGQGVQDFFVFPMFNKYGQYYDTFGSNNIMAKLQTGGQTKTTNEILRIGGKLTLDLNKYVTGLSIDASANYRIRKSEQNARNIGVTLYDWGGETSKAADNPNQLPFIGDYATNGTGAVFKSASPNDNWIKNTLNNSDYQVYNFFINYARGFGQHNVALMAGVTAEKTFNRTYYQYRKGMAVNELDDINTGDVSTAEATGGRNENGMVSYLGRLNYDYKGTYLLEGLFRRDGSSKFDPDHRWANFMGISAGIRFSEMDFLKNIGIFDNLKLRGSYGETGSQAGIDNYYYSTISTGTAIFGTTPEKFTSSHVASMQTMDKTWERIATTNIGLDFAVLNNRLTGSFEYFLRENKGMLIKRAYPATLGATAPTTNSGNFKAKGWELQLNWNDKIGSDFRYNVGFSLADARTEVTSYDGAVAIACGINNRVIASGSTTSNIGASSTVLASSASFIEGKPLNAIYVYRTDGYLQNWNEVDAYYTQYAAKGNGLIPTKDTNDQLTPGCVRRIDTTGDGMITTDDLVYYGDANPHFTFGLNLGAEYKNFDFSMFIQGVGQQYIAREGTLNSPWNAGYTNQNSTFFGKTWTEENPNARYPIMSRNGARNNWNYKNWNDINILNCWYARCKNICLGYTIPNFVTQKVGVERLRIYVAADNLFEFDNVSDGFDPEAKAISSQGNVDVFARTVTFGVDLTF